MRDTSSRHRAQTGAGAEQCKGAIHRDTEHPHVHLYLNSRQFDGKRIQLKNNEFKTKMKNGQVIRKKLCFSSIFAYKWGMASFEQYIDDQLIRGRAYFSKGEGINAPGLGSKAFSAAATRLIKNIDWRVLSEASF